MLPCDRIEPAILHHLLSALSRFVYHAGYRFSPSFHTLKSEFSLLQDFNLAESGYQL